MATAPKKMTNHTVPNMDDGSGFAVTVETTIGHVRFGNGEHNPVEAAFLLIAQAECRTDNTDSGARYRFPAEAGGDCIIEVSYSDPAAMLAPRNGDDF